MVVLYVDIIEPLQGNVEKIICFWPIGDIILEKAVETYNEELKRDTEGIPSTIGLTIFEVLPCQNRIYSIQ